MPETKRRPPGGASAKNYQRTARRQLRKTRADLSLSQTAMGKLLGKSRDTVSRIERGEILAPAQLLPLLARLQKVETTRRRWLQEIARDGRRLDWGD